MGAGRRVQGGALAPPWNLKMVTSYAAFKQIPPKVLLAPLALALTALRYSLKPRKFAKSHFIFERTKHGTMCLSTDTYEAGKLHV